ncbi:hypothetical protein [Paenibacillus koleovorans]|uniref:hypothetical protein n=1 Tax=Paenibacillus koleovorans TaxID=121608 RepID=UPI000FD71A4F|nr:hypothetical protein [Paenibacillus koleovorans]
MTETRKEMFNGPTADATAIRRQPPVCRPLMPASTEENELTDRMYRVLLRWIRYADEQFKEWPERPNAGHFFGGAYWYELETAYTAMVYAIAARLGDYDASLTGQPREEMEGKAIQALRYLGFTHDTGPEECVRVTGRNPYCSGLKWGGRGDDFFRSSQTGTTIIAIAYTAWLLWDELDDETKGMMESILVYYADRWSFGEAPRNGVYYDTQCEENAWTAAGIGAAVALFPDHPNHAAWREAAELWSINAVSTVKDQLLRRPQVSTTTFHPDFTSENHAFVHPSYMFAGISLRGSYALLLLMGGEPIPEALTLNNEVMYERTIKGWSLLDGYPVPVQGQDWWYNRQHEAIVGHAFMNVLHRDPDAGLLERRSLEYIEKIQASNTRGCMLEENGESCIVVASSYQTAVDMEFASAFSVAIAYLLHMYGPPCVEPSEPDSFRERMNGVRYYPYGSIVTHRTDEAFSSFSWRSHVMALTLPRGAMWSVTPLYASYTGEVEFSDGGGGTGEDGKAHNTSVCLDTTREHVHVYEDGFGVTAEVRRGASGQLMQRVGFVSLPDGRSVYVEHIEITQSCEIARLSTGMIGIRNERYSALPELASGTKRLITPAETRAYRGFYGQEPNQLDRYNSASYVNVNDEIGYVTIGSAGMTYLNQHEYPKWKGVEDVLTLQARTDLSFDAPAALPVFVALALPGAAAWQTAAAAEGTRLLSVQEERLAILETAGYLVVVNNGDSSYSYTASGEWGQAEKRTADAHPQRGPVQLFEGRQRLTRDAAIRYGSAAAGAAYYYACRYVLELDHENQSQALEVDEGLEIIVQDRILVIINETKGRLAVAITDCQAAAPSSEEVRLEPGETRRLAFI